MRLNVPCFLFALAAALLTTSSAGAQAINGCVKTKNGALRIVADASSCTSRETPISWNQQGPQGEPGEPGDPEGALQQQLDALQAQTDRLPIVVDSAGVVLGNVLDASGASPVSWTGASVQFDLPGLPLFSLWVVPQGFTPMGVALWFESEDCTGQAWIEALDARGIMGTVYAVPGSVPLPPTGRTFYVADPLDSPETIFRRSLDSNSGVCESAVAEVDAKRVTPLDLDAMFTLPFRLTTRERM